MPWYAWSIIALLAFNGLFVTVMYRYGNRREREQSESRPYDSACEYNHRH